MVWPAKSFDLNPFDYYLWGAMDRYIDVTENQPSSEQTLRTVDMLAAESVPQEQISKAIAFVYDRSKNGSRSRGHVMNTKCRIFFMDTFPPTVGGSDF